MLCPSSAWYRKGMKKWVSSSGTVEIVFANESASSVLQCAVQAIPLEVVIAGTTESFGPRGFCIKPLSRQIKWQMEKRQKLENNASQQIVPTVLPKQAETLSLSNRCDETWQVIGPKEIDQMVGYCPLQFQVCFWICVPTPLSRILSYLVTASPIQHARSNFRDCFM